MRPQRRRSIGEAETEWRAALVIDPDYSDALDKLSTDLIADNNFQGVIERLGTPRLAAQRTEQQYINLDLAYTQEGKLSESARALRDGINTYPDSLPLADQMGRKDEAAQVLEIAHARNASNSESEAH